MAEELDAGERFVLRDAGEVLVFDEDSGELQGEPATGEDELVLLDGSSEPLRAEGLVQWSAKASFAGRSVRPG